MGLRLVDGQQFAEPRAAAFPNSNPEPCAAGRYGFVEIRRGPLLCEEDQVDQTTYHDSLALGHLAAR